ncbi:TPA: hypothetical protein ACIZGT_005596, partial [Escherichia coli]
ILCSPFTGPSIGPSPNGINHAHHLRGLKIVLCLYRRVRLAATFAHCLTLYCDNCYAQKQQASRRMPVS